MIQVFTAFWKQYQSTFSHFSQAVLGTDLLNVQCNSSYKIFKQDTNFILFFSFSFMDTHKNIPCTVNEISNSNWNMHAILLLCKFSFYTHNKSTYSPHLSNSNVLLKLRKGNELYADHTHLPQPTVLHLGRHDICSAYVILFKL